MKNKFKIGDIICWTRFGIPPFEYRIVLKEFDSDGYGTYTTFSFLTNRQYYNSQRLLESCFKVVK